MNVFRLSGDISHHFAILFLLFCMIKRKSCAGISGKTQFLFALVFTSRYLDLSMVFISYYNHIAKIAYILTAYVIIWLIYIKFKKTYEDRNDSFVASWLVLLALCLAIFFNHDPQMTAYMEKMGSPVYLQVINALWTFSIYLEAIAMIPQLYMIHKRKRLSKDMVVYLLAMGLYRFLYILNWVYRYYHEGYYYNAIADIAGLMYSMVYFIGAVDLCCSGVEVAEDEEDKSKFFGDNIFYITNNTVPINQQLLEKQEKC